MYSNRRVRHALLNSGPLPGKTSSARAKTGRGSKTGNASNNIALIFCDDVANCGENVSEDAETNDVEAEVGLIEKADPESAMPAARVFPVREIIHDD